MLAATLGGLGARPDPLLERVVVEVPTPIFLKDLEGRYVYVNRALENFIGSPRDEVVGRTDFDLVDPATAANCLVGDRRAVETGAVARSAESFVAGGRPRSCTVVKVPVVGHDGTVKAVCGIVTDVTERRRSDRARDEQQDRVLADLHDDAVQMLAAVGLSLESLAAETAGDERDRLAALRSMVEDALQRLRTLMSDVQDAGESPIDLRASIEEALEGVERRHSIAFSIEDRSTTPPDPRVAAGLFAIAREAFTNVTRHARASRIGVALGETEDGLLMCVDDDGVGFDEAAARSSEHMGLASMRARAHSLGGRLRIDSRPGRGTRIEVLVPGPTRQP